MSTDGSRTFAEAFGEALARKGLSLGALRHELVARGRPVSQATLSYWRSGLRQPELESSLRAVVAIEEILGTFPGELESLTLPGRRRLPRSDPFAIYPGRQQAIRKLLGQLDMTTPFDEVVEREVTTKFDLDARGRGTRLTHISVVEAITNRARRLALVTAYESPDEPPARFAALGGYQVGRVVTDGESKVTVAEMLLDEELVVGETAIVEQQIEIEGAEDDNELRYWVWPRVRFKSMWIRFHPDRVPARCESFAVVDGVETTEELPIHGTSVHRTATGFGPGTLGIRWFWHDHYD